MKEDEKTADFSDSNGTANDGPLYADLSELRSLLLEPEQVQLLDANERIEILERRKIDVSVEQLSQLLPDAIVKRARQDQKLANALAPTIEKTLQVSVRRDPRPIVEAIFPIIGPAIRKSISEALSSTLESINSTMQHRFSLKSMRWRIEARRSGRTFSEVAMSHTLLYRIEQIFVIDRESGVPLVHTAADSVDVKDGSIVSSMLTVIQDFVQDSFGSEDDEVLETLEVGDVNVWFESGPRATIAAVIRGLPPRILREHLQELVESFHLNYSDELLAFHGEVDPFLPAVPLLEAGLLEQRQVADKRSNWILWLVLLVAAVLLGWLAYRSIDAANTRRQLVEVLDAQPGVVVTDAYSKSGFLHIAGLRDPLAAPFDDQISSSGIDPDKIVFEWEPYHTLAPAIVEKRARFILQPPESVTLRAEDGVVYGSGVASTSWKNQAREQSSMLAPSIQFDDAAIVNSEDVSIADAIDAIESLWIGFAFGSATIPIAEIERIDELVGHIAQLTEAADIRGVPFKLIVWGGASGDILDSQNQSMMSLRSDVVRSALVVRGVDSRSLEPRSKLGVTGSTNAEMDRARSVELSVLMNP